MSKVQICLSAPQNSNVGKVLNKLYYQEKKFPHLELLEKDVVSGYPHNGGQHSLHLNIERQEGIAFLSLLAEDFPECKKEFVFLCQDLHNKVLRVFDIGKYITKTV